MAIKKSKAKSSKKSISKKSTTTKPSKFKTSGQIDRYFEEEKIRILKGIERVQRRKVRAEIALAHDNLLHIQAEKESAESHLAELQDNIDSITIKIEKLKSKATKEKRSISKIPTLSNDIQCLQLNMQEIESARKKLIAEEKKVLKKIHSSISSKKVDFQATSKELTERLAKLEKSQLHVLSRASDLLGKEDHLILSDVSILQKLSEKAKKHIQAISIQIKKLNREKRAIVRNANQKVLDKAKLQKALNTISKKEPKLKAKLKRLL